MCCLRSVNRMSVVIFRSRMFFIIFFFLRSIVCCMLLIAVDYCKSQRQITSFLFLSLAIVVVRPSDIIWHGTRWHRFLWHSCFDVVKGTNGVDTICGNVDGHGEWKNSFDDNTTCTLSISEIPIQECRPKCFPILCSLVFLMLSYLGRHKCKCVQSTEEANTNTNDQHESR